MYNGSDQHIENAKRAAFLGRIAVQQVKKMRIVEYNNDPTKCKFCDSSLTYKERHKKFCNSSCSAKYNNLRRQPRSKDSKLKTSESIQKLIQNGDWHHTKGNGRTSCKIKITNCKICEEPFVQRSYGVKKTCSETCRIIASTSRTYRNGSRKTIYFDNPNQGQVVLESSWELEIAELLVEKYIKWIRPKPIKWVDSKNKERVYYPDFYLTEKDVYLDPKNPYCMELDEEKMSIIERKVNIEYGDLEKIKNYINNI